MIPGPAFAAATVRRNPLAALHPAVRLGGALLAVLTAFALPAGAVPFAVLAVSGMLVAAGMPLRAQISALAAWWPVAVLVLVVHTLTTTAAAPLGQPSWSGVRAGAAALLRVAAAAGWLAVLMRTTNLDELVAGVRWWCAPLRRLGVRGDDLGLAVAVALGTAPTLLGEARRLEAVRRLRRDVPEASRRGGLFDRARGRAAVVVPLLGAVGRRAEALSLSLRRRRPTELRLARPAPIQLAVLALWTLGLVFFVSGPPAAGPW